jgi:DNA-binding transcriptional LysR family regulator
VSCAPTFASRWLVARLHRFRSLHPRIALTLDTAHRQVGFPVDGVDFAIRMSGMSVAATGWTPLFGEWLVPVCSPACRDALSAADGTVDLARATTIHVTSLSEEWQAWRDAADQARVAPAGTIHVDTIQLALEAALAGLGVALGRTALMDRELRDGSLVALGRPVPAAIRYWLVASDAVERDGDLRAFGDWLRAEAESFAEGHAEWASTIGAAALA